MFLSQKVIMGLKIASYTVAKNRRFFVFKSYGIYDILPTLIRVGSSSALRVSLEFLLLEEEEVHYVFYYLLTWL